MAKLFLFGFLLLLLIAGACWVFEHVELKFPKRRKRK